MKIVSKILLALVILVPLTYMPSPAFGCSIPAKEPYRYAVVLKGQPQIFGLKIGQFSAYSRLKGRWTRIAHQIDEVNPHGDFVLEGGQPFTADSDDGVYDFNDDLVFSGADAGSEFSLTDIPKGILEHATYAWKITACKGQIRIGSILLLYNRTEPFPLLTESKVKFNPDQKSVSSSVYFYKFNPEQAALLGDIQLIRGKRPPLSVFSKSEFRMPILLPWYLPDFEFSQQSFVSSLESWRNGPLRAIVAVGVKFKNFLKILDMHLFSELIFYENALQIPTVIEFKFNPRNFFRPGSGLAYALTFAENTSWKIESNLVDLPAKEAPAVIESGQKAKDFPFFYASGKNELASFFVKVRVDPRAKEEVPPPFFIRREMFKNKEWSIYWQWLDELSGNLGVYIDISNVHKGTYNFGLDLVVSSKADEKIPADFDVVETRWLRLDINRNLKF